ncbi:MAG: type II toxin-antitoxin system VapC family toxin [Anaerolineae bacterium]
MIVLDTHTWIWWVDDHPKLPQSHRQTIAASQTDGVGVSAISCWEVAKLVELGRLKLTISVKDWINQALQYPGVRLLPLTPEIAIESTQLPGEFQRDPADQIIVATARIWGCPLVTSDARILDYPHVTTQSAIQK